MKNLTVSKSADEKKIMTDRWLTMADHVRERVRAMLEATLASPNKTIRSTAAVVIAKLAAVEVSQGKWEGLIEVLVSNVGHFDKPHLRQASFEALGMICEEVSFFFFLFSTFFLPFFYIFSTFFLPFFLLHHPFFFFSLNLLDTREDATQK